MKVREMIACFNYFYDFGMLIRSKCFKYFKPKFKANFCLLSRSVHLTYTSLIFESIAKVLYYGQYAQSVQKILYKHTTAFYANRIFMQWNEME
jgi:hypothetical protein